MPDPAGNRDPLTGAVTGPALLRFVEAVLELADLRDPGAGLLRIGVDRLDALALRHSIAARDAVLLGLADRLHEHVRRQDLVGRLGNDLAVCIPDLRLAEARGVAERLRRVLGGAPIETPTGAVRITCSVGLALGRGGEAASNLLDRASAALAAAVAAGGDQVVSDEAADGVAAPYGGG